MAYKTRFPKTRNKFKIRKGRRKYGIRTRIGIANRRINPRGRFDRTNSPKSTGFRISPFGGI